jgi:hypothetical protein
VRACVAQSAATAASHSRTRTQWPARALSRAQWGRPARDGRGVATAAACKSDAGPSVRAAPRATKHNIRLAALVAAGRKYGSIGAIVAAIHAPLGADGAARAPRPKPTWASWVDEAARRSGCISATAAAERAALFRVLAAICQRGREQVAARRRRPGWSGLSCWRRRGPAADMKTVGRPGTKVKVRPGESDAPPPIHVGRPLDHEARLTGRVGNDQSALAKRRRPLVCVRARPPAGVRDRLAPAAGQTINWPRSGRELAQFASAASAHDGLANERRLRPAAPQGAFPRRPAAAI